MTGPEDVWIPLVDEPIGSIVEQIRKSVLEIGQLVQTPQRLLAFKTFAYIRVGILLGELFMEDDIGRATARTPGWRRGSRTPSTSGVWSTRYGRLPRRSRRAFRRTTSRSAPTTRPASASASSRSASAITQRAKGLAEAGHGERTRGHQHDRAARGEIRVVDREACQNREGPRSPSRGASSAHAPTRPGLRR